MYGLTKPEIIKFIIETAQKNNITAYQIATEQGINTSNVDNILKGKIKNPQQRTLEAILKYFEKRQQGIDSDKRGRLMFHEPLPEYSAPTTPDAARDETIQHMKTITILMKEVVRLQSLLTKNKIEFENIFDRDDLKLL